MTDCVRMYNLALCHTKPPEVWKFGFTLATEHVWDAFTLVSLLKDANRRETTLTVPHSGAQKDWFKEAVHDKHSVLTL